MSRVRAVALTLIPLLLGALPLGSALGKDGSHSSPAVDIGGAHRGQINSTAATAITNMAINPELLMTSYFGLTEHTGLIYAHIALMVLGWVILLPLAVMLSIARSRLAIPLQCSFLLVNTFGILVSVIYNYKTPDLYEGNSHHKVGWAIAWIAVAWVVLGLVNRLVAIKEGYAPVPTQEQSQIPVSVQAMAEHQRWYDLHSQNWNNYRWSRDSGQGTERNSASLSDTRSASAESETHQPHPALQSPQRSEDNEESGDDLEKRAFLKDTPVERFLSRTFPRVAASKSLSIVDFSHTVLERSILVLSFVAYTTGIVTYSGVFRGVHVFSGLAHFIKGGIFFWYGLFALSRWMGCFADIGWAWNIKPGEDLVGRRKARVRSAEFVESLLICLYGASNVFLEHLASWGGEYSAQDLEHISITIMFFGGGMLGMLIESKKVRDLMSSTSIVTSQPNAHGQAEKCWTPPKTYGVSLNPIPALIIMLLGLMMSSHHQNSMVSSMMHKQWGMLFTAAALARGITYLILYLVPPSSYLPSRPPSELIASFCLVSGGLIFMGSNMDTVAALEWYELDAMFVFTVTMGFTALLMAWTVVVIAVKAWAVRRNGKPVFPTPLPLSASG